MTELGACGLCGKEGSHDERGSQIHQVSGLGELTAASSLPWGNAGGWSRGSPGPSWEEGEGVLIMEVTFA